MWSRKKRKKEAAAAAAAGGGAKEGAGSSNGSATTTNAKLTLPDLSRSRSQSGSPTKEPHQQRSGSVGPSRSGGDGSTSLSQLANGSLQPASKPQGGGGGGGGGPPQQPSLASQSSQQHQLHTIPSHETAMPAGVVVPPPSSGPPGSNLKQYPLNQNHPPSSLIPPTGVGGGGGGGGAGAVVPTQLHPHAPVVNPSLVPPRGASEAAPPAIQTQQLGVPAPAPVIGEGAVVGVEGVQVKQAHKTLANPNKKPSLTVPLPTVPLSASILESLHDVSSKVDTTGTTGSSNNSGNSNSTAGGAKTGPAISTAAAAAAAQGQLKDPTNTMGAQGSTDGIVGGGGGGVGVMVSSSAASQQQIQQVIDAQRTQLALLSQKITQLVTEQKLCTNPQQDSGGGPSGMMRGHVSSMATGLGGYPQKTSSIASRTQTFDYGNRSNKVLENAAVHQLEQEYYHGDQSGRNY